MSDEIARTLVEYERALKSFLIDKGEPALERAYQLGRSLIEGGNGLVDMASIHASALAHILPDMERSMRCDDATLEAAKIFAEGLSPFEMALRGFRQTNERLHAMNATLEAKVEERTRDLEESRQRYQALVDGLPAIVYALRLDPAPGFDYVSPQARRVLDDGPMTFERWLGAVHPDDRDDLRRSLAEIKDDWHAEHRVVTGSGKTVWLRNSGRVRVDARTGARVLHGVAIDVTEHREIEAQLRQAQKIEGIGQLAGGVAHDFNNLLSVILTSTTLAQEELTTAPESARADLDEVLKASYRAAALTKQLLTFARHHTTEPKVLDPNAVVLDVAKMLDRLLGGAVELVTQTDTTPWNVKIDAGHFEQVIVNLAVNARDAMPKGGKLTISLGKRQHAEGQQWVSVSVTDTGCGMDEALRARIFEPFFTTKEQGKGTGLGLATVFGIVQQAGGILEVDSVVGQGTTFRALLPRVPLAEEAPVVHAIAHTGLASGESVLVVEDDPTLRKLVVRTLSRSGYTVFDAGDGEEAMAMLDAPGAHFDLLLSDLVMPRVSGLDLIAHAQRRHPHTALLLMSGNAERVAQNPGVANVAFLHKPFTPQTLAAQVRQTLGTRRA